MTILTYVHMVLLSCVLSGLVGFTPPWRSHHAHHAHHGHHGHHAKVVHAAAEDGSDTLKVRTRRGATHVKLGAGRHGLEVWSDERGNTRVDLGGAMKVRTDEHGASQVRMGRLAVDTDGSD